MEESNFSVDLGGRAKIIQLTFPIAEWTIEQPSPSEGTFQIPFRIDLPEWLPASMALAENIGNIMMLCKYRLIAQLEPLNPQNWVGMLPQLGISLFRAET